MKSVMSHSFANIPRANIPRSTFDRSHGVKLTMNPDYLVPVYVDEALPGDTFRLKTAGKVRLTSPLEWPIMDNLFLDIHYFSVPIRQVWDNAYKFFGEQTDPGDSVDYTVPTVTSPGTGASGIIEGDLADYLGLPVRAARTFDYSALFHRAYAAIFNEWFRNQNLTDSITVDKDDGPDTYTDYVLQKRAKRADYFTRALPWPQKFDAQEVLISQTANSTTTVSGDGNFLFKPNGTGSDVGLAYSTTDQTEVDGTRISSSEDGDVWQYESGLAAVTTTDLSAAGGTINQLRQSIMVQQMYETEARSGTRYPEIVFGHFSVSTGDQRAVRPEFLGMTSVPVNIHQVAGTMNADRGELSAYGEAGFNKNGFTKSFTEHCIVMGIASVRADLTYQQGMNRMFMREDKLDFYWPKLSKIGEQVINSDEIFIDASGNSTWGYQERFAEYRYKPSTIHGELRSDASLSLDAWHLSEDFASTPALNDTFIRSNTPMDRVSQTTTQDYVICDFYHQLICARPMPLYGVPGSLSF